MCIYSSVVLSCLFSPPTWLSYIFGVGSIKHTAVSNAFCINCHLKIPGLGAGRKLKLSRFVSGGHLIVFTLSTILHVSIAFLSKTADFGTPLFLPKVESAVNGTSHGLRFCAMLQDVPVNTCIFTMCYCHDNPDYLQHPWKAFICAVDKNNWSWWYFFMLFMGWGCEMFSSQ